MHGFRALSVCHKCRALKSPWSLQDLFMPRICSFGELAPVAISNRQARLNKVLFPIRSIMLLHGTRSPVLSGIGRRLGHAKAVEIPAVVTKDRVILLGLGVVVVGAMVWFDRRSRSTKLNSKMLKKLHAVTQAAQNAVADENFDEAVRLYAEARTIMSSVAMSSEKVQKNVMLTIVDQLGHLAYNLKNWEEADMYLRESEKLMTEINTPRDDHAFLELMMMRAKVDSRCGRKNEALEGFQTCIKMLEGLLPEMQTEESNEKLMLYGMALHEYGTYTKEIGLLDESEQAFSKALDIAKVALGPRHEQTSVLANDLATVYDEKGRYNKAERLARKAIKIASETAPANLATYNYNLGAILMHKGEFVRAKKVFRDALVLAEERDDKEMKALIESSVMKLDVDV